jgi:ribonucleoside-triphosphate reductase (formate)
MSAVKSPSVRAQILTRRTYNRPLNDEGTVFETFPQTIARAKYHQTWLWERAQGGSLNAAQSAEMDELEELMLGRMVSLAGRTLWLGGTEIVKRREASNFNCSFVEVRTVHDAVDVFWLLLQGCGVGFKPINGALSGFTRRMEVEVVPSVRVGKGRETNVETFDQATKVWTISIGDSAEAWAKALGKIVAGKFAAKKIVLDCSEIRQGGQRLKGYGWISSGYEPLARAFESICAIMNRQAGKLLNKMDILDVVNWMGTVLTESRASAQMAIMDFGDPEWYAFATAKDKKIINSTHWHRQQSNNSLLFWEQPTKKQLKDLFELIVELGGSEPGFINAQAALARAPWFKGFNPCGEIILANHGFCNLVELDVARWSGDHLGMHRAHRLIARANYRQTLVNLRDGILQDAWHQTNEYLRLCGVGITGVVRRPDMSAYDYRQLRNTAISGAYEMADELGTERPKNVTTIKPSGSLSKAIFDTTEGVHRPLAKYIFNNVRFSRSDGNVKKLLDAGYKIFDHPTIKGAVLVCIPYAYEDVHLETVNGKEVDRESAINQLERYRQMQHSYVDQNTSITISYEKNEIKSMQDWFLKNWPDYVATSFVFRNDATKTAEDLGYAYLPQEVVTKETYHAYADKLRPVDLDNTGSLDDELEAECVKGVCPVR